MSATKTFDDEFNGLSLWNGSSGTWQPAYSWSPGGYMDPGSMTSWLVNPAGMPADANVYSVSNGVLSMAIKPTPADVNPASVDNAQFLSGQLTTQPSFSQTYGYFEMNAELPAGAGTMSAFWLLPENGAWPPELDAEEVIGSSPGTLVMTTHTAGTNGADVANPLWTTIPDSTTGFHTYAVDWEPTTITWYFDGKQVAQAATPADMNTPMYMLVDDMTGTSGSWEGAPAAGTQTAMQINWIHAFTSNPYTAGSTTSSTPTSTPVAQAPSPAPAAAPVVTGTGSDTLVLSVSEDAYVNGDGTSDANGDATFTVSVDGKQLGGTFTAAASHAAGADQAFTFNGDWAPGAHTVTVNFLNDAYAGTTATDRNLYVDGVTYDGTNTNQSAALLSSGAQTIGVTDNTALAAPHFTVSASGFLDQSGHAWSMRGLDMDVKDAMPAMQGSLLKDYPSITAIRLVCNAGVDTAQSLATIVQAYTSKGIVVEIEDHWDTQNADNSGWYASMATAYKSNPYVFLETPNEPDPAGLAAKQIDIINAIRGAGFTNPIGVQPGGGWDTSNIPAVLAQFGTNDGLYETPHIYYNGTDPNGAQQYVASTVSEASSRGIFAAIDEFGNAIDGFTMDPEGNTVITAVTAANEAGRAGAIFWAADNGNHPDGADSAFLTTDGSQLTPTGKMLQPWLSQTSTQTPSPTPTPTPVPTPTPTPTPVPTPTPPPTPAGVVTGTGSDILVLSVSEDAYANGDGTGDSQGDAAFTVSIDGKQQGGTFMAGILHSSGTDQTFTFNGDWAPGAHTVTVNFLNDAYGGTSATDRNLYVDGVKYDGTDTNQSAALLSSGTQDFSVTDNTAVPGTPAPVIPYITPAIGQFPDAAGNVYTLDAAGNAMENGSAMPDGGGTSAMEYAHGTVYAQDAGGSGWYTPSNGTFVAIAAPPNAAIAIPAGTSTENVSNTAITASTGDHMLFIGGSGDTVRLIGGAENVRALQGGNSITTGSKADTILIGGSGNIINAGSGINMITDQGSGNTIVLPGAGKGFNDIFGPVLQNGDKLDLRAALAGTAWNGAQSSLRNYLHISSSGGDATISVGAVGHAVGVADLHGAGSVSFSTLLAHSTV